VMEEPIGWPTYSPNGDRIAFHGGIDGQSVIYSIGVDGSSLVRLTGQDDLYPAWRPATRRA